jgi:type IV pilus assembly protein PilN
MIQINLLPVRAKRRKEFIRKQLSIAGLSLILAAVVMGVLYYRLLTQYTVTKKHLQQTNKRIKQLEPVIKKIEVYKKQKEEISKKIAVIIDLDRHRPVPVLILSDLNRLRPQKLWFTSLKRRGPQLTITGILELDHLDITGADIDAK